MAIPSNLRTSFTQGGDRNPHAIERTFYGAGGKGATPGGKLGGQFGFLSGAYLTRHDGRDARGRLTTWTNDMRDLNRGAAITIQNLVVRNIEQSIKRRAVSTGRLVDVTGQPGNIRYGIDGFAVGNIGFLDRSQSKYWRTIEEGSAATWKRSFRGMVLKGWFGGSISGFYQAPSGGRDAVGGGPYTAIGKGSGGKFVPFNRANLSRVGPDGPRARQAIVSKEIEGMHAYRRAYASYNRSNDNAFGRRLVGRLAKV